MSPWHGLLLGVGSQSTNQPPGHAALKLPSQEVVSCKHTQLSVSQATQAPFEATHTSHKAHKTRGCCPDVSQAHTHLLRPSP